MVIFHTHRFTIGRLCQIGVGLVFLVAGIAKLINPKQFYWHVLYQMLYINPRRLFNMVGIDSNGRSIIWEAAAHGATLFLIPLELLLSVALVINYRPKVTLPTTGAFLVFVVGVTAYASFRGFEDNCGCFGGLIDRTPVETIIEDLVLLAVTGIAWWGRSLRKDLPQCSSQKRLILWTGIGALALNGLLFFIAKPYWHGSDLRVGGRLQNMHVEEVAIDLMHEEYLLVFFSTECPTCQLLMPQLDALVNRDGLPSLVGLSANTTEQREEFLKRFALHYPIGVLGELEMQRLMWTHRVPYMVRVRNGIIRQVWEGVALADSAAVHSVTHSLSRK